VFRLADGRILARVTTRNNQRAAESEVAVAHWLRNSGFAVDQPWPGIGVVEANGLAVTLWMYRDGNWATTQELANVLTALHRIPIPDEPPLPALDTYPEMRRRLARSSVITEAERQQLARLVDISKQKVRGPRFESAACVIHADASVGNLLRTASGSLVLFDLDGVCVGAREWDLVVTAVYQELGWHSATEYEDFADTYGHDVRQWRGYKILAQSQRLRMICWLTGANGDHDGKKARELRVRLGDVLRGSTYRWQPL